jgi:hypothetical protein
LESNEVLAQSLDASEKSQELDIDPQIIEDSPVIREWIEEIPDISSQIRNQPSFRTLIRFGYSQFPSNSDAGGVYIGIEDVFLGNSHFTVSGEYITSVNDDSSSGNDRLAVGGNLKYYLLPLGNYINIAPVIGYKSIETKDYQTDGLNVGIKVILALSPQGAADISLSQNFISPTSSEEVGITEIRAGYALTKDIRLSAGIAWQNSIKNDDSQINIGLEWMP